MTHIKICSVQEAEHMLAAAEAGADYVGLNFVPSVRRRLTEEKAKGMVRAYRAKHAHGGPKLVGIFVDQPVEEVNRILEGCDLDMAQLGGHESVEYIGQVARPVIKAVHVPDDQPVESVVTSLDSTLTDLDAIGVTPLLDPDAGEALGGTGVSFDWEIARRLAKRHRFFLAGGLSPGNVALAVGDVQPWGVDVSSGVETGGIKNVAKIEAFVRQARLAEEQK